MEVEENKAPFRKYLQLLATPERLDEVVSADFVGHDLPPGSPPGIEGLKTFRRMVMKAFPDQTTEIRDILCEDDKVAARIWIEGTHRGDFMGFAPAGKRTGADEFEIARIENGKIAERWALLDWASLFQQLGGPPQSPSDTH
ncbi:MAG: ester cyclase [Candidatus Binataceae bacterium]